LELKLPYGKDVLRLSLPDSRKVDLAETSPVKPDAAPERQVRDALKNPIGSGRLEDLVESKEGPAEALKAAIIIDDKTRPCPDDMLVPLIVERLTDSGIKPENVTVVVATGLHEPPDESEVRRLAGGDDLPGGLSLVGHDAINSDLESIGRVSQGYEVEINSAVSRADIKISTGFIEPHFFAGFSGGRKSILPGVASRDAILANHSFENIGNDRASTGVLRGNPVHEGATEAADLAQLDFALNVVLNKAQEVVGVFAGDFREVLRYGVSRDLDVCGVELDGRYDAVVTTNSGYPLDQDLYQTVKGMYTASLVAKPGAPIIVASECSAGLGPDRFYSLNRDNPDPESVLDYIEKNGPMVAQWENQVLCNVLKDHEICLKSSLSDREVSDMMLEPLESIDEFLKKLVESLEGDERVLALPEGPFSLPYIKGSELERTILEYGE
jgi:nickel-dependent lactate racemase